MTGPGESEAKVERLKEENEELTEKTDILLAIELRTRTERDNLISLLHREFEKNNPGADEPEWITVAASLREAAAEAKGEDE